MLLKDTSPQQFPESSWPNCPNLDDLCPIYKMAQILGADVQNLLVSFIGGAEEGSRLTLQKNQNGFTVQITGAVKRTSKEEPELDLAGLHTLGEKLEQ